MSGRTPTSTKPRMKALFSSATGMLPNQQEYLTGDLPHQMNNSELGPFPNLDVPEGINSWLNRFERPLKRVETGANGNLDVEHHQNVHLDPAVQQKCREVHQMCQFYMRAGHKQVNLPKEFFTQTRMKKFLVEFKGFPKKDEPIKVLKELGAKAGPDNFKKYLVTVWNHFLTTCKPQG